MIPSPPRLHRIDHRGECAHDRVHRPVAEVAIAWSISCKPPVCSPVWIICTTMVGKMPLLLSGSAVGVPHALRHTASRQESYTLPRGTTHSTGCPVMAAIRSKSAS
jgi:hypothetical protein